MNLVDVAVLTVVAMVDARSLTASDVGFAITAEPVLAPQTAAR